MPATASNSPICFTRFQSGQISTDKPGHYPGVLIIEKGAAKGHFAVKDGNRVVNFDSSNLEHAKLQKFQIVIGDATLDDVVACGLEAENTKCKLDHGATVRDIVGDYAKFRRDGNQVRADLTLMDSTPHRDYIVELFKKFAKKVGNSIDFCYSYVLEGDVAVARCQKLNSVDLVDSPAATNSLFNENSDPNNPNNPTPPAHMPLDAKDLEAIGNLVDTKLTAHKTEITSQLSALSAKFEEGDKEDKAADKKQDEKEEEKDSAKMSEIASKAALAAVEAAFPKAQREQFAKLSNPDTGKSKFDALVDTYVAAGAPNRGIAIQRAAKDHPAVYNAHLSAVNAGTATL